MIVLYLLGDQPHVQKEMSRGFYRKRKRKLHLFDLCVLKRSSLVLKRKSMKGWCKLPCFVMHFLMCFLQDKDRIKFLVVEQTMDNFAYVVLLKTVLRIWNDDSMGPASGNVSVELTNRHANHVMYKYANLAFQNKPILKGYVLVDAWSVTETCIVNGRNGLWLQTLAERHHCAAIYCGEGGVFYELLCVCSLNWTSRNKTIRKQLTKYKDNE